MRPTPPPIPTPGRRTARRLAVAALAALGALAMLALPSTAAARRGAGHGAAAHRAAVRYHRWMRRHDRNHDRIPDPWERRHHLSLRVKQTRRDQDHDGLANVSEYRDHTNPRSADTDGDGLNDGHEVRIGDNPRNPDTNGDGVEDGDEMAGTIASFDGTTLTIDLFGGGTVSGAVTEETAIECDGERSGEASASDAGESEEESGDDSRSEAGGECGAADLTPGTPVQEAELAEGEGEEGAVFEKVELGPGD